MKLIEGAAAINKEIGLIAKSGQKLADRIQVAGLSVLNHVELHGDITVANSMLSSMPNGTRRKALVEWMLAHGKLSKNTDKGTKADSFFSFDKEKATDLTAAMETPWYEFAKSADNVDAAYDLQGAVKALLSRVDGARKKGTAVKSNEALDAALVALRAALA